MEYFIRMTGCRRSEAINLKWTDIAEQIHIRETKTDDSDRYIPIVQPVQSMLDRRRLTKNSEYVFATSNGTRLDGSNLLRWMRENTNYTVHDLRHTYITRGAQAGVNPKVLQTLTGHKRIETLLNIYTHVSDQDRTDAAQKTAICIASAIPSEKPSP
ncbi:MAG: site-specific integrase [Clostridiaceae bacterium]|nr:site-specific integrase [Clostridiaceae bacterium]